MQNEKNIQPSQEGQNKIIFSIKDINRIDEYYTLEISFEDIQTHYCPMMKFIRL